MAAENGPRADRRASIRVLGPVEVSGPLGSAALSRGHQRALLGVLAVTAGVPVQSSRLVKALWDEAEEPRTALRTLHGHVARVRRSLRACGLPDDLLVTSDATYMLDADRGEVDALRFADLVAAARAEVPEHASESALQRLRDGLSLWRGDPLEDVELFGWARHEAERLTNLRLTALEYVCRADLHAGRPEPVVHELQRILVDHPGQEKLVALFMRALHQCGRMAEALDAYERLKTVMSEECDSYPSPELRELNARIKKGDPGRTTARPADRSVPRPAQLPPRVGHFTGRDEHLAALTRVLDYVDDTRVAVVSGAGGMGKTALTVQWAHAVRDRFPDGQLFLDLRGHDDQAAMSTEAAVARALSALGAQAGRIPAGIEERVALLRSLLDGRRVLIVLDNAQTTAQVRPLVPPTPTSMLVVTSRRPLSALSTFHAVTEVTVEPMARAESLELLREVVGRRRVDLEPTAAIQIVERCGRMPLALRISAAKLAAHPDETLGGFAAELSSEGRLDVLAVDDGLRDVRSVFASGYRSLSAPAARLFRRLGLHPGEVFGKHLATAMAELSARDADDALLELVDSQLLTTAGDDYYRFHDLLREYARERARLEKDPLLYADTVTRLLDWYLGLADLANRTIDSMRDEVRPVLSYPLPEPPFPADRRSALAFLDRERANLLPVVQFAVRNSHDVAAWQLTFLLTGYFDSRGEWVDRVQMCRDALVATERANDPAAESLMGLALGTAYLRMLRFSEALDCLHPAMRRAQVAGDHRGESRIRNCIATAYARLRRYDEAVETYQQALAAHETDGDLFGAAAALNNIGAVRVMQDRPDLAFAPLDKALHIAQEMRDRRVEALILGSIGEAHLRQGAWEPAVKTFQLALRLQQELDDLRHQVDSLLNIGSAFLAGDQHIAALDNLRGALAISRELADQHLTSRCLKSLAQAHLRRGELDEASECLRSALAVRAGIPDLYEEATIHEALAEVAETQGQAHVAGQHRRRAELLYREANAQPETDGVRSPRAR